MFDTTKNKTTSSETVILLIVYLGDHLHGHIPPCGSQPIGLPAGLGVGPVHGPGPIRLQADLVVEDGSGQRVVDWAFCLGSP